MLNSNRAEVISLDFLCLELEQSFIYRCKSGILDIIGSTIGSDAVVIVRGFPGERAVREGGSAWEGAFLVGVVLV